MSAIRDVRELVDAAQKVREADQLCLATAADQLLKEEDLAEAKHAHRLALEARHQAIAELVNGAVT